MLLTVVSLIVCITVAAYLMFKELSFPPPPPYSPLPYTELVLRAGARLEVTSPRGSIAVSAGEGLARQYQWDECVFHSHASLQLTVEVINAHGQSIDVTRHRATSYQSLAPSRLSVSATGLVTAAPTVDIPPALGGDLAVLVHHDHPRQPAWNKLFFNIVP